MLKIDGLTKRYGQHTVVDNLSFACTAGEVLGFLGPNGAGKSTTMKMITGFVLPEAGTATVCGYDIAADILSARRHVGYLPEGAPCYPEMTPRSFLEFIADVRELSGETRRRRLDEVIGQLHLEPVLEQSIDTLSKGFKRRVGLAQAILHDPDVLILDEPTDGLDPNQKHEVRELIRSMSAEKLIVISTHILEEVEAVCSRAIIISAGRILADDTPRNLAAKSRYHNAVRLTLADDVSLDEVQAAVAALDSVDQTEVDREHRAVTAIPHEGRPNIEPWQAVSELVKARNWRVSSLQLEGGRLDEVFRQITMGTAA
jgi:ABC-2 type transport system ATP-binding protein